jgi:hypothetical protein
MTIQYDNLLARLRGVRKTHPRPGIERSHRALCPCHQSDGPATGRTPSLSIGITDTGIILLQCHAGCSAAEVAEAAGLNLSDLFTSLGARDGRDGGARGNGGPASWVSAAACASAVSQLADEFLRERNVDVFLSLNRAIQIFKKVARAAMRESRGGAK